MLTSLAYQPEGHALRTIVPLVDRKIYPAEQYPDGQWDYYRYYATHFKTAIADLDADKAASLASIFRPGDPPASARFHRKRWLRATEDVSALRTTLRALNLTRLSGGRLTSTCWRGRSKLRASAPPALGT